jgi:hypothetical protein
MFRSNFTDAFWIRKSIVSQKYKILAKNHVVPDLLQCQIMIVSSGICLAFTLCVPRPKIVAFHRRRPTFFIFYESTQKTSTIQHNYQGPNFVYLTILNLAPQNPRSSTKKQTSRMNCSLLLKKPE